MWKHRVALTPIQQATLQRLSQLDFSTYNETEVRENYLVPLIGLLGYARESDYQVLAEAKFKLDPLWLKVGSKQINLDYRFNIYKSGFWLLEAKAGRCANPKRPPAIGIQAISQAHFYAHHREIDTPLYGVSNGWWIAFYDRDGAKPTEPILAIRHRDLLDRFDELYGLIGASQVTFRIKRALITRIEQVLSADVDLGRTPEFLREVASAAARARPKVLENFRRNAQASRADSNDALISLVTAMRPEAVLDNVFTVPMALGQIREATRILSEKVAAYPGSNQYMFFHHLLVVEPRAVTMDYYFAALSLLAALSRREDLQFVDYPAMNGKRETAVTQLFADFAELLLTHFEDRPDLELIWAVEGLLARMTKRALVADRSARAAIAQGVAFERYLRPEEEIAFLGPSPARSLVAAFEAIRLAELGLFVARHKDPEQSRRFALVQAHDEFVERSGRFAALERETDENYDELLRSLGTDWSELTFADQTNRTFDRLGAGVCNVLLINADLLSSLSQRSLSALRGHAARGTNFAAACLARLGEAAPALLPASERVSALSALFNPPLRRAKATG